MAETPQEERICFDSARTPHVCSTKWVDSKVEVEGEDTGFARTQSLQRVLCRNFGLINLEELDKNYERDMYLASGQAQREKLRINQLTRLQAALFEKEQQLDIMKLLIMKERETNKTLSMRLASSNEEHILLEATKAQNFELTKEIERLRADTKKLAVLELTRVQAALFEKQQKLQTMELLISSERETNKMLSMQLTDLNEERSLHDCTKTRNHELVEETKRLSTLVSIFEHKAIDAEKRLLKARKESEERLNKSKQIEVKMEEVHLTLQRLEEKMSFLEIENQVLHKVLASCPTNIAGPAFNQSSLTLFRTQYQSDQKLHNLSDQRQQETRDMLISWNTQDMDLNAIEPDKSQTFDRLFNSRVEVQRSHETMAYCLSHTLYLLRNTLKPTAAPVPSQLVQSLMGRMSHSFSQYEKKFAELQQLVITVEKLYGMLRDNFKKEISYPLTACIQAELRWRAGGMANRRGIANRQDWNRQLGEGGGGRLGGRIDSRVIGLQVKATGEATGRKCKGKGLQASRASSFSPFKVPSLTQLPSRINYWHSITNSLNSLLTLLRAKHVPSLLVSKLFTQIFFFINVQLFNSLLLRRECCSFSNGECFKAGLNELEIWICNTSQKYIGHSWDALGPIRQAVEFLQIISFSPWIWLRTVGAFAAPPSRIIHQKDRRSFYEIKHVLCPGLSMQQLYRITTMYWDDKYGTQSVCSEVIDRIKELMAVESSSPDTTSFLLDDDSSLPFCAEDLMTSMSEADDFPQTIPL
ncbi:hypothetical protein L7F22_057484 [Adiantum nelumboides]|nr:hypothetical protein [Adiantum nelumboides]